MNTLEKLNKQAEADQDRINRIEAKLESLQADLLADPDNNRAASEAAAAKMQLEGATMARVKTERAITAEKAAIAAQELASARAKLDELKTKAEKIKAAQIRTIESFNGFYSDWLSLVNEHSAIAARYHIDTPNLMALDEGQGGMSELKYFIDAWNASRQNRRVSQQMANERAREARN